jgi:t-SNARE complex subunit (syntaxin)
MIDEREYTAALLQTEIATIDGYEQIDEDTSEHLKETLKTFINQSTFLEHSINKFREIKPFDRTFIYKGEDYIKTMKQYYGILNRVLQVHEIDLSNL